MDQAEKKGLSLFPRLLMALIGIVVLISGMLTAVFYVYTRSSLERQTTESVLQQFETISYHFRYELRDSLVKDLQLLAANPLLDGFMMSSALERDVNARALERFFLESLRYSRNYESISYVDVVGKEVIRVDWSGRVRKYRDLSNRPLFQRIKEGEMGSIDVGNPTMDEHGNVQFTAGIHKIDADIGKFGGAVMVEHSLKDFISYLDRIRMFEENPVWLFKPDGTVLKQPDDRRAFFDPRPVFVSGFHKTPELVLAKGNMVVYQDFFIHPDRPLVRIAVSIPASLLLHDIRSVLRFFFIVSLIALAVISVIAYYLAGYLSRPIVELAHAASLLAQGELSTRVQGTSTGEVQLLIDSFNRMSGDLNRTTVSRDYVDNIINSMMDMLIVASTDRRILRVNAAVCRILGYKEAELVGQPIEVVIEPGMSDSSSIIDETLARGSVGNTERVYRTRLGKGIPVLFSASVMQNSRKDAVGIVCVAQDITERKQDEEKLTVFSKELQEINEELKNFAYIVSHDLRAPLVNIKGFSQELDRSVVEIATCFQKHLPMLDEADKVKIAPIMQHDIPEALKFIGSSVNRMDSLINAILQLSRAGRRSLVPVPLPAQDLVKGIIDSLAHQIEAKGARVVAEGLPQVVADKTALGQIFGNLLDNAVKYLDPGRPGVITVSAEQNSDEFVFHVRDNGRGMAKEDIPKAFEVFRRVGRQDVPGEGMGLAFVKTLVRLLGGRIWCESEPGQGTTFSFTIPDIEKPGDANMSA